MVVGKRNEDLTGRKFGRLTVIGFDGYGNTVKQRYWKCQCECGEIKSVRTNHLMSGKIVSCGCFGRERRGEVHSTHRMSKTRIYGIWAGMISRCQNESDDPNGRYLKRGIKVCDEWKNSFEVFYEWAMKNGYSDDLTIDRIDFDKDYTPDNCRWADKIAQANNKSNNIVIEYRGEIDTIANWCRKLGVNYGMVKRRYYKGWDGDELFSPPLRNNRRAG